MRPTLRSIVAATFALTLAACSGPADEETVEEAGAGAEAPVASVVATDEAEPASEAFEVCDADGNRYPSEADAEAAGLDRAEYGATFCEYAE